MRFVAKDEINKGWSGDQKFCVTDEFGNKFLLRISPYDRKDRVKKTFDRMKKIEELGISMCHPLEFGVCEEGVYVIQSWVDGRDAEDVMPDFTEDRQYAYGLDAGEALRKIHSVPAEENLCWEELFYRKIDRKIAQYNACELKYRNGDLLIEYINANRHLLKGRPVTYQHGDFHIGNMMIDSGGKLVVIDFDRDDIGDPWEEFNRIVWSAQNAPSFARGIVDGYFGGKVPVEFWRLLALYIANNTISSLPWAIPFGEDQVHVMIRQCDEVLEWYDFMKNPVPIWYRNQG